MKRRKSLNDFRGFSGVDVSIETSLLEYGIAWKLKSKRKQEYIFCYGIGIAENENRETLYNRFSFSWMTKKEFVGLVNESWFNIDSVLKTCGIASKQEFIDNFPYSVSDAISYHGTENIFGSDYFGGFHIVNQWVKE
jgi:hypothetical protein